MEVICVLVGDAYSLVLAIAQCVTHLAFYALQGLCFWCLSLGKGNNQVVGFIACSPLVEALGGLNLQGCPLRGF